MVYAAIRVRGTINVKPDIKKTLKLLRLTRANHCTLLEETKPIRGMLQIAKDYITWGEIDTKLLHQLIDTRGMIVGDRKLTDEYLKDATPFDSTKKLTDAIIANKFSYTEIPEIKPLFRLHPPRKGYRGIKRSYTKGGALGYRGKEINTLLERML